MSALTDAIKNSVDIVDVASRYVNLKKSGSNFTGLSPFKKERTPSFVVSPQKQIFKCFSTGIGGNVITLVMELEKVDFMDGIKILAGIGGVNLDDYLDNKDYDKSYNIKKQSIKTMNGLVDKYARGNLKDSVAWDYCTKERKLSSEIIDRYGLGYLPKSFDELIKYLRSKGFNDDDMLLGSLAKKSEKGLFSFFRHRLIFPIWDHMDNVIAFGARALDKDQQPKYLNTSDTALYDKSKALYGINFVKKHIRDFQKIIVVEGYMDVIALASAGFPIAVATCGTSLTKQHLMQIQRYSHDVYFLFDNDEAGLQATLRGLKLAYDRDIFPKMIDIANSNYEVKDVDDLIRAAGENSHSLISGLIDNAEDCFMRIFSQLKKRSDGSPVQQQKLLVTMFELVQSMHLPNVQFYYLSFIAEELGADKTYIDFQYRSFAKKGKKIKTTWEKTENKPDYRPKKTVLLAALFYKDFLREVLSDESHVGLLYSLVEKLIDYHSDELFSLVLSGKNISEDDIGFLEEEQLWREKELTKHSSSQAKRLFVRKVILDELNKLTKQTLKTSNLNLQDKQSFLTLLQNIIKK